MDTTSAQHVRRFSRDYDTGEDEEEEKEEEEEEQREENCKKDDIYNDGDNENIGNGGMEQRRLVDNNADEKRKCSYNNDDNGDDADGDDDKGDTTEGENEENDEDPKVVTNSGITVDKGRAWFVMISCFLMYILVMGGSKSFGVFVQEFQDRFQVGARELGVINGMSLMLIFCLSIFVNMLVVRFSARRVVIAGGLLTTAGFIMTAYVPSFQWLYVSYGLVVGLGYGLSFSPIVVMVGQSFHKYRALAYGLGQSGGGVGSFVMPILFRVLVNEFSLRGCLLIMGALMLNLIVCGLLLPPRQNSHWKPDDDENSCVKEKEKHSKTRIFRNYKGNREEGDEDLKLLKCTTFAEKSHVKIISSWNENEKDNKNKNEGDFHQTSTNECLTENSCRVPETMPGEVGAVHCPTGKVSSGREGHPNDLEHEQTCISAGSRNGVEPYDNPSQDVTTIHLLEHSNEDNHHHYLNNPSKSLNSNEPHFVENKSATTESSNQQTETNLNGSSNSYLPDSNTLNTKSSKIPQLNSINSKKSLNKSFSSLESTNNSSFEIAIVSEEGLDSPSNMTSRSQELTPASQVGGANGNRGSKTPLFEWSLLRNPAFIMHLVSALLGFASYMNNLFMLADYATENGLTRDTSAFTLSVIGVAETIARLTIGPLTEALHCRKRLAWAVALAAMSILSLCAPSMKGFWGIMTYSGLFGYSSGCFTCFIPVLCAETNGPEKLGSSFGLTTFGMGVALMAGPPMCGAIKDGTGSWDTAFIAVGVMAMVAAILAFLEPLVRRRWEARTTAQ